MTKSSTHTNESRTPVCVVSPVPILGGERRFYRGVSQPFRAHSHDYYVIGKVISGERELELNGESLRIEVGDIIVLNPGDVHACQHVSEALFAYDSVTIAIDKLDGCKLGFPDRDDVHTKSAFDALMLSIANEDDEETIDRISEIASLLEVDSSDQMTTTAHEDAAVRAYAHLCGHLAEPVSIAELAASEGISEYALIRAYRKRFSITPLQHLISLRIECACKLLSEGASPSDVANETGFSDQAHLTRVFKQRIGTTPAAYRSMVAKRGALV